MSTTLPEQPAAPDYAKANQEGIFADIDTLATRRAIEQGARLGNTVEYVDPRTGEKRTADFTGLGDIALAQQAAELAGVTNAEVQRQQLALREELGTRNAAQTAAEIQAADPLAYQTRQDLTAKLGQGLKAPQSAIAENQHVLSAAERVNELAGQAPGADNRLSQLYDAATGLPTNVSDGGQNRTLQGLQGMAAMRLGGNVDDATARGRLNSIYDEATRLPGEVSDSSSAALNLGLQQAIDDYARGGELDPDTKRQLLNETRAGQVARGNYLGDGAAVAEATELGSAMEQRRAQRLQTLLDVQQKAFTQNSALRGESATNLNNRVDTLAGLTGQGAALESGLRGEQQGYTSNQINTLSQLAQQLFGNTQTLNSTNYQQQAAKLGLLSGLAGQDTAQQQQAYQSQLGAAGAGLAAAQQGAAEERTTRQENFGRDQQALANASAMVLGQPITNQFGALGSAQQGAVGYNPTAYTPGTTINANAGNQAAQFSQQTYGQQANMWQTTANIAQQDNAGKMSMISGMAGAAMGMV